VTLIATGFGREGTPDISEEFRFETAGSQILSEVGAPSLLSQSGAAADRNSEREPLGVPVGRASAMPGSGSGPGAGDRPQSGPAREPAPAAATPPSWRAAAHPGPTRKGQGEESPAAASVAERSVQQSMRWDPDIGDGVVGPARPISSASGTAVGTLDRPAADTPSEQTTEPSAEPPRAAPDLTAQSTAAPARGRAPSNVIPLAWKKNLRGANWAPRMSSRWQRVLRRERFEVPSFLRRGRQMD
jgi:hypothetical protein